MHKKNFANHFDLVTPDGVVTDLKKIDNKNLELIVSIEEISSAFVGFQIDKSLVFFNLKSALAQLGLHSIDLECELSPRLKSATVKLRLHAINELGEVLLDLIPVGAYVGKLFAADDRRRVRDPFYLSRMFGRTDMRGKPLLSLGELQGKDELILKKIENRTIAYLTFLKGRVRYDQTIQGFLPTIAKSLTHPDFQIRKFLQLHQTLHEDQPLLVNKGELLLTNTLPLHIRTVYGRVVDELLPEGVKHTSASVLQPDTHASGDIYELFGENANELTEVPVEFYTLEPYREFVFFEDRDQLQSCIEKPETLFHAMESAPKPRNHKCAVFVVKGTQLLDLSPKDWIRQASLQNEFPGFFHPDEQVKKVEEYIQNQPSYQYLEAIDDGTITSQGILLTRHLPSPLMKRLLMSEQVLDLLKGIYFVQGSRAHGEFFSHEDRSLLFDLAKFGIPIYWLNRPANAILQYVPKPEKDSGMFVPLDQVETFINSTMIGIYGSNLIEGDFEPLLTELLQGLMNMRDEVDHPLLNAKTPLALVTGGGSGVMSLGNRVAKGLGILSCANIIDFSKPSEVVNEQQQNPYIDAKMTYRIDRLVERQAEFHLDLPLFLIGGIGTDFEFALEEVRRKVGMKTLTPILLFGEPEYWEEKISSRFLSNIEHGTIEGSEWISNCFYCVQTAKQGLQVYLDFFKGKLLIGKKGPVYKEGFKIIS